jgi:biuret amidohydrolase
MSLVIAMWLADACGAGEEAAAQRSLESLRFADDAIISDTETFTDLLKQA